MPTARIENDNPFIRGISFRHGSTNKLYRSAIGDFDAGCMEISHESEDVQTNVTVSQVHGNCAAGFYSGSTATKNPSLRTGSVWLITKAWLLMLATW